MKKHLLFALALFSVVLTGTQKASAGDPGIYTSNLTLSADGGESVYVGGDYVVNIDAIPYAVVKMGTSSKSGTWKVTVPAGTEELSFYAVSWKGKSCQLTIEGATATPNSIALTSNDGASGNQPYTIVPNAETEYYTVALSGITADTELTFTTDQRCVIWGVNSDVKPSVCQVYDTTLNGMAEGESKQILLACTDSNPNMRANGGFLSSTGSGFAYALDWTADGGVTNKAEEAAAIEACVWTITKTATGFTLQDKDGNYIQYTGGLTVGSTADVWTVAESATMEYKEFDTQYVKDITKVVRFVTSGNTFLNNDGPKLAAGLGDWSYWCVYQVVPAKTVEPEPEPAPAHEAVALITDAAQLSSNASDSAEGKDLGALLDGSVSTFWHTDWHGVCTDEYHYLQVELNVSYEGYVLLDITRRNTSNDHPTTFLVEGSNDGETFSTITSLDVPFGGAGIASQVPFQVPSVKYLRFSATNCTPSFRTYWHAADFQLYAIDEYTVAKMNLEDVMAANAEAYYKSYDLQTSDENAAWYLWSNAPDQAEGLHPEYLLDGNTSTFFHSDWHGVVTDTHYMALDCGEGNSLDAFVLQYSRRTSNNNNRPTEIEIQGSNDGENYTTFRTLTSEADGLPTDATVNSYTSDVIECGAAYRYLRFMINKTNNSTIFFTFSEFNVSCVDAALKAKIATAYAEAQAVMDDANASAADLYAAADRIVEVIATHGATLAPGKYFLRNKANGKYIMNGEHWGTHAVFTSNYGFEFNVTANENGTYTLGTFLNEGKSLRDSDGFTDQTGSWTIEATDKYNTYTLKGSAGYLGYNGTDVVAVNLSEATDDALWEILTKDQLFEEALAGEASYENPIDLSFLITGRNFCSHGSSDNSAWTPDAPSIGGDGGSGTSLVNSYNGEFWNKQAIKAAQTFTGLPDGYYEFKAFAFYRNGGTTPHADAMQAGELKANAYMFINDTKQPVKLISDEAKDASTTGWSSAYTATDGTVMMYGPNTQGAAASAFAAGAYQNSVIAHVVGGTLTLGFAKDEYISADWFVFDEPQLFYLGSTPSGEPENGTYYLYNKESNTFLSRGATWGTEACLDNYGYAFNVSKEAEGFVFRANDWTAPSLGLLNGDDGGSYVDHWGTENKHSLTAVEGGYKISNNLNGEYWVVVENPVGQKGIGPHGTEAEGLVFDFITPDEYENLIAIRWANQQLAAAQAAGVAETSEALADTLAVWSQVNETSKIKSAALASGYSGWTWTSGRNRGGNLASDDNGTECYQGIGELTQTVTGLEPGFYKVTLQGFYRSNGDRLYCFNASQQNIHNSSAYLEANGNLTRIKAVGDEAVVNGETIYPNWMWESKDCFDRGLYMNEVYTYVGEDGVLNLTIAQHTYNDQCWMMMRNVTLTRYVADPYATLRSALTSAAAVDVTASAMGAAVAAEFKAAVAQGEEDLDKNVDAVNTDAERILAAIAAVEESVSFYEEAAAELAHEANFYAEGLIGAVDFNTALTAVQKSYNDRNLAAEQVEALKTTFNSYVATNLANAGVQMDQLVNGTFGTSAGASTEGWTYEGNSGTMGTGNHNNWTNINDGFVERWTSGPGTIEDFEFYQEVSGLPAGTYVVSAYINACQQSNSDDYMVKGVKFYAGSDAIAIHTFNVDRDATNKAIGAGQFYTAATVKEGETLKVGISVSGTDANWFLMDNVKLFNLDPDAALAVVLEKAKALIAENPDVKGVVLANLNAEVAAANDIDALSNAMDEFKAAIDVYTEFAALERQYDDVALLAAANKAAKAVLNGATTPVEKVAPAYEEYKQAVLEYCLAVATVDNPVDVTALYVKNPNMNEGVSYWDSYSDVTGWGSPHAWQEQSASYSNGSIVIQQFIESWGNYNGCGKSYALQTSELPNGFYKFSADIIATVQGADDTKAAVEGAYLVFGDGKTAVATNNGQPERFEVYGNVTDGKASFGFNAENTNANWICMDNVKLEFVGHQKVLGYFTLAGKSGMVEGAEDPIYKMLAADPKIKVVLNEVSGDFDGSLDEYDAVLVQESFDGADEALVSGALSIGVTNRPMLFNQTFALGMRRGSDDGVRATAQGDWFVNVENTTSELFNGIEGETVRLFFDGASDNGTVGTKGLSYIYGMTDVPEGSLVAVPSTVSRASLAISDFHSGDNVGGKTLQARVITLGMNYGALCREGGKYLTDETYTIWRNAVYMLLGMNVPTEMVDMDVNDVCEVAGVSLDVTATEVGEDQVFTLTATVLPETAADKSLVWTSSDENVATVVDGVVTGVNKGECDITVTTVEGGFAASCHVTVFRTRFHTYDFREWSEETQTNMAADAKSKTNWQKLGSYYKNTSALTEGGMTTENGDVAEAKGLLFTAGSGNLRVYYGDTDEENYVLFFAAGSVVVPTALNDQVTVCVNGVETTYTAAGTTLTIDMAKGDKLNWIQVEACGEGIESIANESDVVSSAIYTADGKKVAEPVQGVNIVKKTHVDGTITTEKFYVK